MWSYHCRQLKKDVSRHNHRRTRQHLSQDAKHAMLCENLDSSIGIKCAVMDILTTTIVSKLDIVQPNAISRTVLFRPRIAAIVHIDNLISLSDSAVHENLSLLCVWDQSKWKWYLSTSSVGLDNRVPFIPIRSLTSAKLTHSRYLYSSCDVFEHECFHMDAFGACLFVDIDGSPVDE